MQGGTLTKSSMQCFQSTLPAKTGLGRSAKGYAYKVTQCLQSALPVKTGQTCQGGTLTKSSNAYKVHYLPKQGTRAQGVRLQSDPILTKYIACQSRVDLPRGYAYKVTQRLQSALPCKTGQTCQGGTLTK